jgi:glycogen debranching enzyme
MKFFAVALLVLSLHASAKCNYLRKGVKLDPPAMPTQMKMDNGWQDAYSALFDRLCVNLKTPNIFFKGYRAHPSPKYIAAYLWDTAFISQTWMYWDTHIAQELMKYIFRFQGKDGIIHHAVLEILVKPYPYNNTQPPLLAWATWRIFERSQDKAFLADSYSHLKRYHEWLLLNRKQPDGLFFWKHPYESGIDNSPRFSNRDESIKQDTTKMAAVDMSSYMAMSMESLAKMANVLGLAQDKTRFEREYQNLKTVMNEKLWDERDQTYYDWDYRKNDFIRVDTISNLTPMAAGIATEAQAQALMVRIMDPLIYNTRVPFPSVARNDPTFIKDMWQGPVWINMAYLGVIGVDRYGHHAEAANFAKKLVAGVYGTWMNLHDFYEYYDPDRYDIVELTRKKGNWWKELTLGKKPVNHFAGWTALANTLILEYGKDWQ